MLQDVNNVHMFQTVTACWPVVVSHSDSLLQLCLDVAGQEGLPKVW